MRLLFWLIILFIIAISTSIWLKGFSANLFFTYGDNLYEINLVTFTLFLFIGLLLLYIIVKIVLYIFSLPQNIKSQYLKINVNHLNNSLIKALIAYFEGEYLKSIDIIKNSILKNSNISNIKSLALILGADSANKIDNIEARDFFLNQLEDRAKDLNIYKNILKAEYFIKNNDYESAKNNIKEIKKLNPNLTKGLMLELEIDRKQNNNDSIIKLSNTLYKNKIFSKKELDDYQVNSYKNKIQDCKDIKSFKSLLKKIPSNYKDNQLQVNIALKYKELGLFDNELKWILKSYSRSFDVKLLDILLNSFVYFDDKQQLIVINEAENWLLNNTKDDKLLLFLGQVTYLQKLWGKSQGYLEASFNINNDMYTGLILAKVLKERGKTKEAQKLYDRFLLQIEKQEVEEFL